MTSGATLHCAAYLHVCMTCWFPPDNTLANTTQERYVLMRLDQDLDPQLLAPPPSPARPNQNPELISKPCAMVRADQADTCTTPAAAAAAAKVAACESAAA